MRFAPKEPVELNPPKDDSFTFEQLAEFDGVKNDKIYVAIRGTVFDVTKAKERYGPGGSYHVFAGKDASCALAKSSLEAEHVHDDVSALTDKEKETLEEWMMYFSQRYNIVGKVVS
ncbi:hypothetical protein TRVA0_052S01002 [Trichomonascus vanleenenianus]|uniref:cytochrome b5-like heme/steroid binding domain-containing protein n=1 Tax=Trichomonascus vanleenenianus TaxID=2268995 RepID=UPI003ECA21C1